jgi:putative PEP-CTERM system histidine kinase
MQPESFASSALWAYIPSAVVFVALAVHGLTKGFFDPRARWQFATSLASLGWAVANALAGSQSLPMAWKVSWLLDVARALCWLGLVSAIIRHASSARNVSAENIRHPIANSRWLLGGIVALAMVAAWSPIRIAPGESTTSTPHWPFLAMLGLVTVGLLLAERVAVTSVRIQWWAVKPFVIGFGALMGFDLIYFANAAMWASADPEMWGARGVAHAVGAALVAVSAARLEGWRTPVQLSQRVALQFWSVLAAGGLLLAVSIAGYGVNWFGAGWSGPLKVVFLFTLTIGVLLLVFSGAMRARLRVFVAKNFLAYRYDYRAEWNRFTTQFGNRVPGESHPQQLIRALGNLVESEGGQLWCAAETGFRLEAELNAPGTADIEPPDSTFVRLLAEQDWIVDLSELANNPARYPGLQCPEWLTANKRARMIVPLKAGTVLVGFVVLNHPNAPLELDWEIRDILKTAGSQVAMHWSEVRARQQLVESAQFDAFNRMSAFVVHDLKNLIAQLDLMVRNAERHRDNPEFQADMLQTVRHAVSRMQQLMLQMRSGTIPAEPAKQVDLAGLARDVAAEKSSLGVAIMCDASERLIVSGHADRLARVAGHLMQNAVEASMGAATPVGVRVFRDGNSAVLEVSDSGAGMSDTFVREKLFRPFQTTKANGMGIGVYESGQYVRGLGGQVTVKSTPFAGSTFRVTLPLASTTMDHSAGQAP